MTRNPVNEAVKQYFKTTTLHGFKYLYSSYYVDRVGWLVCCCTSACCAGVLCAVLMARFSEVPAVLRLWDNINSDQYMEEKMPAVVVCPSAQSVAEMFLDTISPADKPDTERIPINLARLLVGKSASREQLELLNELLMANNVTLKEMMLSYTPSCSKHTRRCRYQDFTVPCEQLFEKEFMTWGLCCVMRPRKLKKIYQPLIAEMRTNQKLELVLQCTHGAKLYGCQFITMYDHEEYIEPDVLIPGYYYMAQLRFTAIPPNPAADELVESTCVAHKGYNRNYCLLRCAEESCGCTDPFHSVRDKYRPKLPICPVAKLRCLKSSAHKNNITCNCLPSCKKISTYMVLESSPMNFIEHAVDPLYSGLNVTPSIVVNLRVNVGHSRIFVLNPTETWLTLLSSLGGVFNMFLGVGLFSALELLFLFLVKLPIALKKSSEIDSTAHVPPVVRY